MTKIVLSFVILCCMSVAYGRSTLQYITEVDRERDSLRRQLKDPEEFIRPLSQDVGFYIAGQKKLNYEKKLTPEEQAAALQSILRTAVIHSRFKEASFTDYFGGIKAGQRDLYYRHVAHVNIAYCAAQCLVENQMPLDILTLVQQVLHKKSALDIFQRQPFLQEKFTEAYITKFLSPNFIRWYIELNVGYPDVTNQFVFDARLNKMVEHFSGDNFSRTGALFMLTHDNMSKDKDFPCYACHASVRSCHPDKSRNFILCYELAELMGLHGLVAPAYSFRKDDYEIILLPHAVRESGYRTDIDELLTGREKENPDLYSKLTNANYLSKILTFWFLTEQTSLRSKEWIYIAPDQVAVSEVRESMGSVNKGKLAAPYPFGTKKLNRGYGYYEKFPTLSFSSELMQRIKRLQPKHFEQVFRKHNTTQTEEREFYERLAFFQEIMERFSERPIHEMFLHLWEHSLYGQSYKLSEWVEEDRKPVENPMAAWDRIQKMWKENEEKDRKLKESGSLMPSESGVGYVKYPRSAALPEKTGTSITDGERARRRKLTAEAADKRTREAVERQDGTM